jgi:ATP-dependent helicase/nuclease subunit B
VITPRVTRLVRVPDLHAMQRAILALAADGAARRTAIIVPTRGAAVELRRTFENVLLLDKGGTAMLLPDLVTRVDLYERLAEQLPDLPPLLTGFEREVLFGLAAGAAEAAGTPAPFRIRPGLIVEVLAFYDELRRNLRTIDDFHRLVTGELIPVAEIDQGAERLLRQAEFLAASFAELERRTAESGRIDEHALRALLLERAAVPGYEHIILAVADRAADSHGLWTADFDLLARMPGVRQVDVVATERLLATGFHQRLHEQHLPGIEDVQVGTEGSAPVLVVPTGRPTDRPAFVHTHRDREEELVAIARSLKSSSSQPPLDRTAVLFQRPLPYIYLARQVFGGAHLPYQATDALPLAGEPFAAGLDLVFAFVATEATRSSLVELLASPQWTFVDRQTGKSVQRAEVAAVDTMLREAKYLGGWDALSNAAQASNSPALRAADAAADALAPLTRAPRASEQVEALHRFILAHERLPRADDSWQTHHLRARSAVLGALDALRDAHIRHDDRPVPFADLAATIRRWIEGQTFAPRMGVHGLLLLDTSAAQFADVDDLRIVGLVDGDWPDRSTKSIFFPARLLEPLGWTSHTDRLAAARARFHDLLRLPSQRVSVSTFSLEDDAIVAPSSFVDELRACGLAVEHQSTDGAGRIFDHEALSLEPVDPAGAPGEAATWLALRQQLPPVDAPQFHGSAGPREAGVYAVSRLERFLECPFKYFAAHILRLDEEREEESGLTPRERGQFLHIVFEDFFRAWEAAGHGAITADTLDDALVVFETIAERHLDTLPHADRAVERTYLLGSAVAPGLAERAFAFEIEHGVGVIERLLEHALEGTFVFSGPDGARELKLKGKADRIDLLENGTLRVVDYKTGRAPKPSRSIQLAVYSICAQQQLAGRHGREWSVSRAGYMAFREKNAFVPLGTNLEKAIGEGEARLLAAVTAIEEGRFPPRPEEPWLCTRCGYAMVCRKDYVGDE